MRVLDVKGNTEAENESPGKWKGHITASIAAPLERTWQIGSDFSGLHKFVPIIEVCERLKGRNRTPGCLRFYTMNSATGLPGGKRKAWAKDRLLNIDEETHSYTYAVEGSNMHLENCKISFKASDGKDGTIVKWGWELDPIQKSTKEKTLSDMSEFGCTFIKGLEAAAAVADAIDFDFEGAPPETHSGDDEDGCRHVHPVLSLMKSRLETLTQSLNNISQKLEDGPVPPDLYSSELENLQSILAEGRRSLASHIPGYNSDTSACESKSLGTIAESHEDYIQSTIETISPPRDASTGKIDHEACYRKCVDAISRLRLSDDKGKAIRTLDGGQCQGSSAAMFPPLGSKGEELLLEMDTASRGAYAAFQDFSNQFHNDLRDDISHQLESVEARLDFMSSGLKDGDFHSPKSRSDEENSGGHESPQTATQRSYPDARWSPSPPSDGANMCCLRCRNPEQFEDWELEKLHSVRARSGLLFRDLLQEEMSQDSDNAAHHEANSSLATFEVTNSPRNLKATMGCAPCCLTQRLAGQRSPPSNNPKVTNVPREYHQSQLHGKESGRFESGPRLQDDNTHVQGGRDAEDLQDLNELETQRRLYQGLKMDHEASEVRRRTLGPEGHRKSLTALILDDSSSQEFQSSEESGEGFQQLQDSIQGWKQRGSKMRRTPQNLENDLRCLQSTEYKLQECGDDESGSREIHKNDGLRRPSRLPTDIWPDFLPGEFGREGHLVEEEQGEDSTRRNYKDYDLENFEVRREEFHGSPPIKIKKTRTIVREPASLSSSSSQSSKNDKKFIELQSLPAKFSSSGESLPQTVAGGSRNHTTSPISSLDEISSTNSSVAGSHSGHLDQQSQCPLCALHSLGQCAQHVILDLSNEIAPGVFHCRQGKQTRVIIDIPGDLEARQASKRHLRSLLRKVEIYKEFALLGIQKPPTEEKLLADFASARYKEQGAISESETPIYQPYCAHGRVFPPDAGPSPTNVDKSRSKHPGAYPSSSHPTKSKSPSGHNAGHSPETQTLTSKNVTSQRRPPTRIIERRPQSEQPFHVTDSFHKDERYITSEGLRGETTARELAGEDHPKRTKPPRGGFHPYPGSQPRAQSAEGSTCRHGFPLQQKREIPIKGNGRRTSHVRQPSSSKGEAKSNAEVSSPIASSHVQPSSSQGKPKTKSGVSTWTENSSHNPKTGSGDTAYGEYTSMGSGNSFVHQELVDEIPSDFSTGPEIGPEIRIYSQARDLLKINTPGIAIHTRDAQQPEGSPRPSSEGSMAKILINFPRDSGDARLLELTHYRAPTSRQGSLEQVVNNVPSELESLEFDPYKPGGKLGSINGSTGSDSTSDLPFSRQLHIGDVHQHITPTTDQPPNLPNSFTLLRFNQTEEIEQPNTIDSLTYLDEHLDEGKGILNAMVSSSGRCHGCPFGELKREVDQLIQTSKSGSPCSMSPEFSVRVSWADQHSRQSPLSSRAEGKEESEGTLPPGKIYALREVLSSNMLEGLKRLERGDFLPQPTRSHLLDEVSGELDAKLRKSFHNTETQTEVETGQHTETAGMEPRLVRLSSSQDTQASTEPKDGGLKALQYSQILDSMASSAAESTDDLKAQTHKLDEMVQQSGDVGLISIWNAKKKRKAEALAVRTRSTATMLNSAINVKEFTEDSRSYSTWLDGVAHEAATQTPHGNAPQTQSFETQTSRNLSESSESSEELPRREPRFREDSAANFLGSVAGQILHEFSDAQKTDADARDQLKDPQEPRFREDSAANFLSAISQKIVQEFTDYTLNETPILDQSEVVPRERRFREQSALKFLEALSGQLLPEFKNRSGTRAAETSQAGEATRFREASAINFLDALRDLVMRTPDPNSVTISEGPSSSDQTVKSEASQGMPGLKKELNSIEDLASHPHPEGKAYPTKGLNYQPESESQEFLGKGLSSQPESESNGFLGEGLSSQPELDSHGFPGEGSSSQREWESHKFPGEGSSSQPESESHGFPGQGLSSQHESESHGFLDEDLSSQPESESHGFLDEGLSSQPKSEGQGFPDEGLCYQPESEGQGYPDDGLNYQPESEGQGFPDEGLSYQPDPEGDPGDIVSSQPDGSTSTTTDQESQNQLLSESHRFQAQLGAMGPSMGPQGSRRSSQVAVLNEMLQDLHATVSRSRQNSVSNPKGS